MKRTHVFPYYDEHKNGSFIKVRFETNDERGKTFRYFMPYGRDGWNSGCFEPGKPDDADRILYRLPQVLRERKTGADLFWTEGERDADAIASLGYVATSHHQAAGHATQAQADWLKGWRGRIYLVADRDIPGAVCALRRYDLLRWAGIPARKLRIVRTRIGKDARDHIEAGHSVNRFHRLDPEALREIAETARAEDFTSAGYTFNLTADERALGFPSFP
ncbi:hypothetical protein [Kribbella italica]|uniref:Toprim domain-containing protein n=1 Tax=Kribbella italica TaxID=1540520 RepID=A0A7W9J9R1_9ACTN|nr:hypothetical protein [Kribbella italica]MBB5837760.1 hypothetical protein [Kribbella italica]